MEMRMEMRKIAPTRSGGRKNNGNYLARRAVALAAAAAVVGSVFTPDAGAATDTWSGATDSLWGDSNWTGVNNPPQSADSLVFTSATGVGGLNLNNNLTSGNFTIGNITFASGSAAFVIGDGTATDTNAGNAFTLTGGITNNSAAAETINDPITLNGNQSFTANSSTGNLTFGGNITGTVTLTTAQAATAGITATTLFTGNVTLGSLVSQGNSNNTQAQSAGIYTAEPLTTFTNATLNVSGNAVVGRSNLVFNGSTVANITGNITNAGAPTADWAGVVISGSANVTAANLNMAGTAATGQFYLNGGTLTVGSISGIDSTVSGSLAHNVLNGTQIIASGNNSSFLTITKSSAFAGSSEAFVGNNGALFNTNGFNIGTSAALQNDTGATGLLIKSGNGALTLAGANTYTGTTTVNAGTLQLGNGTAGGDGALGSASIVNNSVLTFNTNVLQVYNGVISGNGINKIGPGSLVLGGSNSYGGATNISAGTLRLQAPIATVTAGSQLYLNAAAVSGIANGGAVTAVPDLSGNSRSTTGGVGSVTYQSAGFQGNPTLVFNGAATLNDALSASGNTGTIFVVMQAASINPSGTFLGPSNNGGVQFRQQGILTLNSAGITDIADSTAPQVTVGTREIVALTFTQGAGGNETFYVNGAPVATTDKSTNGFTAGLTTVIGARVKTGSGAGTFDFLTGNISAVVDYNTALTAAQITATSNALNAEFFGSGGAGNQILPSATPVNISASGAALDLAGWNQSIGSLTGVAGSAVRLGNAVLTIGGGSSTTFAGSITDSGGASSATGGSLSLTGASTLVLTGANTFSGTTTIDNGSTLQLGNGTTGADGTVNSSAAIIDNGTLIFNRGGNPASAVPISGNGAVIMTGAGSQTLSGNSSYTGGTTINAGTLNVTNTTGSATGSGNVTLAAGSLAGNGSIAGTVNVNGGTVAPGAAGTILTVGGLVYNSGNLSFSLNGNSSSEISAGNVTFNAAPALNFGPISGLASGDQETLINSANPINNISDATGITENVGRLTLTTAAINGNDTIVLNVSGNPANLIWAGGNITLGTGTAAQGDGITWNNTQNNSASNWDNNGNYDFFYDADNVTFSNTVASAYTVNLTTNNSPGSVTVNAPGVTYLFESTGHNGSITGGGNLTVEAGTLQLNTSNTYSGGTTISTLITSSASAILVAENALALPSAVGADTVTVSGAGAKLDLNGFNQTVSLSDGGNSSGTVTSTTGAATLTINNNTAAAFSGTITGNLSLTEAGTNTFTLSNNNTYSGLTTVTSGTLIDAASGANDTAFGNSSSSSGGLFLDPSTGTATVDFNSPSPNIASLSSAGNGTSSVVLGNSTTLTVTGANASNTFGGVVSGGGGLTMNGSGGVLTLQGANSFTGATSITAGIINYQNATAFGKNSAITVSSGGTAQVQGNIASTATTILTISGTGASGATGALENVSGTNSASMPIVLGAPSTISSDAGSLTLTGGVTGAFNLTLASQSSGNGALTFSTGSVNNGGTITNSGTAITGNLSSTGTGTALPGAVIITSAIGSNVTNIIENSATSDLLLGANNSSYTHNVTVTNGTVVLNGISASALGTGTLVLSASGSNNAGLVYAAGIAGTGTSQNLTFANPISVTGAGTNFISATNWSPTFSGNVTLNNTTLTLSTNNSGGSNITLSGGVTGTGNIIANNAVTTVNNASEGIAFTTNPVNNSGTITFTNAAFNGSAGSNGAATGSGTVANSITGGVGSNVTAISTNSGSEPLNITTTAITVNSGGTTLTNSNNTAGVFTVSGGVNGTGNLTLDNNSAIANGITLSGSSVSNGGAIINSGNGTGAVTISAPIGSSVTGGVTQNSSTSLLVLSGNNSYSGPTTINAGTLTLSNAGSSNNIPSSSAINVASGATLNVTGLSGGGITLSAANALTGSGTVTGNVTTASASVVAPGTAGVGTLTVGNLTLVGGSVFNFGLNAGNATADLLSTGTLTLPGSGSVTLDLYSPGTATPFAAAGTYDLFQFSTLNGTLSNSDFSFGTSIAGFTGNFSTSGNFVVLTLSASGTIASWNNGNGTAVWSDPQNWTGNVTPMNAGDAATFGNLTNGGTVTLDTSGIVVGGVTFNSANSYTVGNSTNTLTLNNNGGGASIAGLLGNHTINVPISIADTAGLTVSSSSGTQLTLSGNISATASQGITISGAGTLVLSGTNTYGPAAGSVGTTLGGGGTLQLGSNAAMGAGDLSVISSSTLRAGGNLSVANNVVVGSGAVATIDSQANTFTLSGNISGAGGVTKIGSGTLVLATGVAESYSGGTTVSAGTLQLDPNFSQGNGQIRGNLTIGSGGIVNSGATWALGFGGSPTVNYVNNIVINGGNLEFGAIPGGGGTAAQNITMQGGTISSTSPGTGFDLYSDGTGSYGNSTFTILSGNGPSTISANMNLRLGSTSNNVTFNVGSNDSPSVPELLVSGNITNSAGNNGDQLGNIVKTGSGTMQLAGTANSYSGSTSVDAGTLLITGNNSGGGSYSVGAGGTLTLGSTAGTVSASGLTLANSGTTTANLNGGIFLIGSGGISIPGFNGATALDFSGGTLESSTVTTVSGGLPINILSGGATIDSTGGSITFGSGLAFATGSGNLTIQGGNTVTTSVSAANETGIVTVTGSSTNFTLDANSGTTSAGLLTINTGATLDMNSRAFTTGGLTGAGTLTDSSTSNVFTITGSGSNNFSGAITGSTALTVNMTGAGTQILSGNNSYSGITTINAGTLQYQNSAAMSSSSQLTMNNGSTAQLRADGNTTFTTSNFNPSGGAAVTLDVGPLIGSGNDTLTLSSTSTIQVGGAPNVTMTFNVTGSNSDQLIIASATGNMAFQGQPGQTLVLNPTTANLIVATNLSSASGGTGTLSLSGNSSSNIFSGNISNGGGAVSVAKINSSTWTFTGNNAYSGPTSITAGTLALAPTSGTNNIASSAYLNVGSGATFSVANVGGTGANLFALSGTGNQTTSQIIGGTGTVTGTLAIANGATLSAGTNKGTGTVNSGASAVPATGTTDTIGALNTATIALAAGGNYAVKVSDTVAAAPGAGTPGTPGTNYDTVVASGPLMVPASPASPFNVQMLSYGTLASPVANSAVANFDTTSSYVWQIASFTSTNIPDANGGTVILTGANADPNTAGLFTLDTTNFVAANPGTNASGFFLEEVGGSNSTLGKLDIAYSSTPEPGTTMLVLGGAVPMLMGRRRRRQARDRQN
jgi:fibronectin-binding autotransporter adhesin